MQKVNLTFKFCMLFSMHIIYLLNHESLQICFLNLSHTNPLDSVPCMLRAHLIVSIHWYNSVVV